MREILDSLSPLPSNTGLSPLPANWEVRYLLAKPGPDEPFWATQFRRMNERQALEILVVVIPRVTENKAAGLLALGAWAEVDTRQKTVGRSFVVLDEENLEESWERMLANMAKAHRTYN